MFKQPLYKKVELEDIWVPVKLTFVISVMIFI